MKKKIVFVIPNMTGGGTERVISLLSNEYVKMGYQVAIMQFAGYERAYELNKEIEDFSIAPQSKGNPLIWIKRLIDMRKYFKQNPVGKLYERLGFELCGETAYHFQMVRKR